MPRLFFALSLPESIEEELDDLCDTVTDARWVGDSGFHLTLSFVGDVPEHLVSDLVEAGESIRVEPLSLELRSVGVFPLRGEPRVLYAGVEKNEGLLALEKKLTSELRRRGYEIERRKFRPHVTVGRISRAPRDEVADWVGRHMSFSAGPFWVRSFELYSSVLLPDGSRYREEATFGRRAPLRSSGSR